MALENGDDVLLLYCNRILASYLSPIFRVIVTLRQIRILYTPFGTSKSLINIQIFPLALVYR